MRPTTFLRQLQVSKNIYMQNNVYKKHQQSKQKSSKEHIQIVYVVHYKCRESPK